MSIHRMQLTEPASRFREATGHCGRPGNLSGAFAAKTRLRLLRAEP